eukprot:g8620.t1
MQNWRRTIKDLAISLLSGPALVGNICNKRILSHTEKQDQRLLRLDMTNQGRIKYVRRDGEGRWEDVPVERGGNNKLYCKI